MMMMMMNDMQGHEEEVHEIDHDDHGGNVSNWIEDQEMWFNDHETEVQLDDDDVVVVVDDEDDRSNGNFVMSYGSVDDDHEFPPLPDFPCVSSSSSSSSCSSAPPPPTTSITATNNNSNNLVKSLSFSSSSSSSSSLGASTVKVDLSENKGPTDQKTEHHMKMETTEQEAFLMATDSMETIPNVSSNQIDSSDCMNVMEELADIDQFIDTDDIWDPSCLFPNYENLEEDDDDDDDEVEEDKKPLQQQQQQQRQQQQQQQRLMIKSQAGVGDDDQKPCSEDLAMVFLEWLKSNKESISAEDLRSIKLKRSTIECAAKRLGGGKEGMKQLLKLILEWVQNHQLQKKRVKDQEEVLVANSLFQVSPEINVVNENVITSHSNNPYTYLQSTNPPLPWVHNNPSYFSSNYENASSDSSNFYGFMGDPMVYHHHVLPPPHHTSMNDYQMRDQSVPAWPPPPPGPPPQFSHFPPPPRYASFPDHHQNQLQHHHVSHHQASSMQTVYAAAALAANNQYACQLFHHHQQGHVDGIVRLGSSATKEARKKRMARQKRFFSHHHRSNQNHNQQQNQNLGVMDQQQLQHSMLGGEANHAGSVHANQANWVFWPSSSPSSGAAAGGATTQLMVSDAAEVTAAQPVAASSADRAAMQGQQFQPQIGLDRRQGCKNGPEKNLKFLLQKVLKQSDVGNLGRIVLPKKEAETYLPELEARDGISIAMEDIGTSRTWNMRYRFWPNNKSRMYLLENTGDFVRSNGLQEGDFIVIYSDIKCGKYMIRGVKVRQPGGSKMQGRKQGKAHRNLPSTSKTTGTGCGSGSRFTGVKETMT